jgi:hypothetical protein
MGPFPGPYHSIGVDATSVYVGGGAIQKLPKTGGAPTTIVSPVNVYDLAVDASNVYWVSYEDPKGVQQVPVGGGTPTTLATWEAGAWAIAVDAGYVYWGDQLDGQVKRVPIGGGPVTTLAQLTMHAFSVAVDATNLYWAGDDKVMQMPKGGGQPIILAAPAGGAPAALAVDSSYVYWVDGALANVVRIPIGVALGPWGYVTNNQYNVTSIAVDAKYVYLAAKDLLFVPVTGGTPIAIGPGLEYQPIAADATCVYWCLSDGSVWKVVKPV